MPKKEKAESTAEVMKPDFEEDYCCDFDSEECHDHDEIDMTALIEAHQYQSTLAFELTSLIVENASAENKTEEAILNSFVRALKVVSDNSPLKDIFEN
ncbi:MAG: hypothetical protein NTZ67_08510 [Gammaproteobacteria bacterium]|nr:hypothetical protein [Gammaproteobacteria bacterium]